MPRMNNPNLAPEPKEKRFFPSRFAGKRERLPAVVGRGFQTRPLRDIRFHGSDVSGSQ